MIGLISNPNSRQNRTQLAAIQRIVADCSTILHRITKNENEIAAVLTEFAESGVTVLAINGGDGTIAAVLTALFNLQPFSEKPKVILLPGGTTNMNVGDVGMQGNLKKVVKRLVVWSNKNKPIKQTQRRNILSVSQNSSMPPACGMFFGTGIVTRGIEYSHQQTSAAGIKREIGPGTALLRTLWGLLRKEPYFTEAVQMKIQFDETRSPEDHALVLLMVSSLERLMLGMRPYWGKESGALHCSWIESPHRKLFFALPSLLRGKPNRYCTSANGYVSRNSNHIQLWMNGTYTLDGELYQADAKYGPVTICSAGELEFLSV